MVLMLLIVLFCVVAGLTPDAGLPDMTVISDINEKGINRNLKVRYDRNQIYVSFYNIQHAIICEYPIPSTFQHPYIQSETMEGSKVKRPGI